MQRCIVPVPCSRGVFLMAVSFFLFLSQFNNSESIPLLWQKLWACVSPLFIIFRAAWNIFTAANGFSLSCWGLARQLLCLLARQVNLCLGLRATCKRRTSGRTDRLEFNVLIFLRGIINNALDTEQSGVATPFIPSVQRTDHGVGARLTRLAHTQLTTLWTMMLLLRLLFMCEYAHDSHDSRFTRFTWFTCFTWFTRFTRFMFHMIDTIHTIHTIHMIHIVKLTHVFQTHYMQFIKFHMILYTIPDSFISTFFYTTHELFIIRFFECFQSIISTFSDLIHESFIPNDFWLFYFHDSWFIFYTITSFNV